MIILSQVPLAPGAHSPGPVSPFDPSTGFDWSADAGIYVPTQGRLALATPYGLDDWTIPVTPGVYGAAFNIDSKDNQRLDGSVVAVMFIAATTTTITNIVWQIRRGVGYSLGTLGTVRVSVKADDGTSNHRPTGADLASTDVGGGADHAGAVGGYVINTALGSPPTISKGTAYHVVFTNVDGSPASNYVSVNSVWTSGSTLVPRQPAFDDALFKMSYNTGTWATLAKDTADIDIVCADGNHLGSAYVQAKIDFWGVIAGPNGKVRCNFTVSGGDKIVTAMNARISQQSGTGPLTMRLETGAGTLIESGSVATTGVAAWTLGADPAAGTWFRVPFAVPHVLTNGSTYHLVLSTDNSSSYAMVPMLYRDGSDDGTHFMQSRAFTDGTGEVTTDGTTYSTIYGAFPQNIQTYFETMATP